MTLPYLLLISHLLGLLGAAIVAHSGHILGFTDQPNTRSSHTIPTPKGGGIGIIAAFIITSLFLAFPISLIAAVSFVSFIALYGDKKEISPSFRLLFQFGAAAIVIFSSGDFSSLTLFHGISFCFWLIFIVGTANFYNFMDGINGLAGITGAIAFGLLAFFLQTLDGNPLYIQLSLCIAVSIIGFLPFNMFRARVFMGDVGSIFLGFLFSSLLYLSVDTLTDFVYLAALLFPFYIDELSTMVIRLRNGENISKPHRNHIYQLAANEMDLPHWAVTIAFGLFQLTIALGVYLLRPFGLPLLCLFLVAAALFFLIIGVQIRNRYRHIR